MLGDLLGAVAREPLGAIGTGLAGVALVWNIVAFVITRRDNFRKSRTRLKVDWDVRALAHGYVPSKMFVVKVTNESEHAVDSLEPDSAFRVGRGQVLQAVTSSFPQSQPCATGWGCHRP